MGVERGGGGGGGGACCLILLVVFVVSFAQCCLHWVFCLFVVGGVFIVILFIFIYFLYRKTA